MRDFWSCATHSAIHMMLRSSCGHRQLHVRQQNSTRLHMQVYDGSNVRHVSVMMDNIWRDSTLGRQQSAMNGDGK